MSRLADVGDSDAGRNLDMAVNQILTVSGSNSDTGSDSDTSLSSDSDKGYLRRLAEARRRMRPRATPTSRTDRARPVHTGQERTSTDDPAASTVCNPPPTPSPFSLHVIRVHSVDRVLVSDRVRTGTDRCLGACSHHSFRHRCIRPENPWK